MVGKTILHYKIIEKIGEGGMGVVYKAEDTKLKRDVAIKFLPRQVSASDEERERFKIEAQAAAAMKRAERIAYGLGYDWRQNKGLVLVATQKDE